MAVGARREALVALLVSSSSVAVLAQPGGTPQVLPLGCYNYGFKYEPAMPNVTGMPFRLISTAQCQARCRATPGCAYFGFFEQSQECWLGAADAYLVTAPTMGAISGPAMCPQENPACSAIPGPGFPGSTPEETRAAWPNGNQPSNLKCWPRKANGFPATCQNHTAMVLEDTASGWPGRCKGLMEVTLRPEETCQSRCFHSPMCGVWAMENQTTGQPKCWHGLVGQNCFDPSDGLVPMRSQSVMHGSFRVLMNTMGMHIKNLTKAFDVDAFENWEDGASACRKSCLSLLLCQYWQYSDVYGCFIENDMLDNVAYPLVNNGIDMETGTAYAASIKAGEFIQHTCEPGPWTPLPVDTPSGTGAYHAPAQADLPPINSGVNLTEEESGLPMWGVMLTVLAVALCLAVVGAAVWMSLADAERKSSRKQFMTPGMGFNDSRSASFSSQASGFPLMQQGGGDAGYGQQHGGWDGMAAGFQGSMWHNMHWPGHQQPYQDPRYAGVPTTQNAMGPSRDQLMQYAHGGGGYAH